MPQRSLSFPLVGALLLAATALAGCSGDDSDGSDGSDGSEADVTACRTVVLANASLDGTRRTALDGIFTDRLVADYDRAISTVSEAVSEADVSDEVADETTQLVGAWSRNKSRISQLVFLDSYGPDALQALIGAEQRVFQDLEAACPESFSDDDDDNDDN